MDFVHVEKTIGGAIREGGIFDVFAEHACTIHFAASEETSAMVIPGLRRILLVLQGFQIVGHHLLLSLEEKIVRVTETIAARGSASRKQPRIIPPQSLLGCDP
jgi:hypothetical protein